MAGAVASVTDFPLVVIFDLDFTFWPLDVDTDPVLPFSRRGGGGVRANEVIDAQGTLCALYPDVRRVLSEAVACGARVAFASRTTDGAAARAMLEAQGLWVLLRGEERLFQAYPSGGSCKTVHFAKILDALGMKPEDALFFDDMRDNIDAAVKGGTASVLLGSGGLTFTAWEKGLRDWGEMRSRSKAAEGKGRLGEKGQVAR